MSGNDQQGDRKHERDDQDVAALLQAAAAPEALADVDHEALIALALGEDVANITADERAEAEALRRGLAGEGEHPLVGLAEALRAAWGEAELDTLSHERILRQAQRSVRRSPSWGTVVGGIVAAAAVLLLMVGPWRSGTGGPGAPSLATGADERPQWIRPQSAAVIFEMETAFPRKGGESRRVERIAQARAADLRANRFAAWGVR